MRMISKLGISKLCIVTAVSASAMLAGVNPASAQSAVQVIPIAPGVSLVITGQNIVVPAAMPALTMPDPQVMIQQIEQTLAQAQRNMVQTGLTPVTFPAIPQGARAVVVSSFSDGTGTCTRHVIYPANGAAPQVKVSSTGNACQAAGFETVASPSVPPLPPATVPHSTARPHLVVAANNVAEPMRNGSPVSGAGAAGGTQGQAGI